MTTLNKSNTTKAPVSAMSTLQAQKRKAAAKTSAKPESTETIIVHEEQAVEETFEPLVIDGAEVETTDLVAEQNAVDETEALLAEENLINPEETKVEPEVVAAVETKPETKGDQPSKASIARTIFAEELAKGSARQVHIKRFMAEADLTKAGASTYYQNFCKEHKLGKYAA